MRPSRKIVRQFLQGNITTFAASFKLEAYPHHPTLRALVLILYLSTAITAQGAFERTAQPISVVGTAQAALFNGEYSSVLLNPSAAGLLGASALSVFYSPSPFGLSQLSTCGLVAVSPIGPVGGAFSATTTGFSLYRELVLSATVARSFEGTASVGANLRLNYLAIERFGSTTVPAADLAAMIQATDEVKVGLSVLNLLRGRIAGARDELPVTCIFGISWQLLTSACFSLAFFKEEDFPESFRTSVQFSPMEVVRISVGLSTEPSRFCGGVSFRIAPFWFEYAIVSHDVLGLSHSLGISFCL